MTLKEKIQHLLSLYGDQWFDEDTDKWYLDYVPIEKLVSELDFFIKERMEEAFESGREEHLVPDVFTNIKEVEWKYETFKDYLKTIN